MRKDKKQKQKKGWLDIHLNQLADSSHSALVYKSADTLKLIDRQRQLHEETDEAFIKSVNKIMRDRQNEYLKLLKNGKDQMTFKQCQQLHFRAKIHSKANTINRNSHLDFKELNQLDKCLCGCQKGKGKYISFCINDQKLRILGPGVLLQLLFQKASAIIVLAIIIIYCIFAITTNYMGGQAIINQQCRQDLYCQFKHYSSDENKDINSNYQAIQNWLGVVFCLIWIFALKVIRYVGKQKNLIIDEKLNSAADCAIKVQNLPRGTYQQQELIGYLEGVWQKKLQRYFAQKSMGPKSNSQLKIQQNKKYKLKFKSIQIIYNMEFARRMINQILYLTHKIDSLWMKSNINGAERVVVQNKHQYKYTKIKLIQSYELLEDFRKRFLNDREFRNLISTTCCIIQFENQKKRRAVLKFMGQQKVGLLKQLCLKLKNFFNSSTRSTLFHHKILRIQRAPEPSDILWENCEKPESVFRKLGIFLATFCVMGVAFGIIFALTYFQEDVKLNPNKYNPAIETVVNNFIGIVLQIINTILWMVTSNLLNFQYNHTQTQKITSLMTRILILNSINVIALPIFSNFIVYGKEGIYGNNGLVGVVFDYHTSAILAAVKGLFNITAILKTIGIAIRWIRHKIIWFLITDPINIDIKKGDPNVNKFYEGIDYDIAQGYMFIIIAILHASFFCHLQPVIVIILFIMIIIFYLVNRVKLLYLCKMPGMTQHLVFDLAIWMLGFVPIYYSAGTIILSYAQNQQKQTYPFSLQVSIPAIICGVLGIFGLLNPLGILNKLTFWFTNKIIGNIDEPEQYEMDEDDFIDDQEVSQCQFMVQQTKVKQTQHSTRVQSYYDESNSLILLGFEKVLKNQKLIQMRTQLKNYCQSFFPKQLSHRQIVKQIILDSLNQLNIQNEANQIKIKPKKKNKYKDNDHEESPSQNR